MAAYRRVYGFGHLLADWQGPVSSPEPYTHFEYLYLTGVICGIRKGLWLNRVWRRSHIVCGMYMIVLKGQSE